MVSILLYNTTLPGVLCVKSKQKYAQPLLLLPEGGAVDGPIRSELTISDNQGTSNNQQPLFVQANASLQESFVLGVPLSIRGTQAVTRNIVSSRRSFADYHVHLMLEEVPRQSSRELPQTFKYRQTAAITVHNRSLSYRGAHGLLIPKGHSLIGLIAAQSQASRTILRDGSAFSRTSRSAAQSRALSHSTFDTIYGACDTLSVCP